MHSDLILYTNPRRPLINPKLDTFAWLDTDQLPALFPALVVDTLHLMLPERCRHETKFNDDTWDFILWQVEEKGYTMVRSIDGNWLYWSILPEKFTLLNMVRLLVY